MLWYQYQIPLSASISVRDIQTLYTLITAAIHPCAGAQGVLAARLKKVISGELVCQAFSNRYAHYFVGHSGQVPEKQDLVRVFECIFAERAEALGSYFFSRLLKHFCYF